MHDQPSRFNINLALSYHLLSVGKYIIKRHHKLNKILRLPLSKGNPKDKLVSIHFLNFIVLRKGIIYLDHGCVIINLWSDNQLRSSSFVSSKSLWTRLWKLKRPTKCLVFLWKIIHNVLSVKGLKLSCKRDMAAVSFMKLVKKLHLFLLEKFGLHLIVHFVGAHFLMSWANKQGPWARWQKPMKEGGDCLADQLRRKGLLQNKELGKITNPRKTGPVKGLRHNRKEERRRPIRKVLPAGPQTSPKIQKEGVISKGSFCGKDQAQSCHCLQFHFSLFFSFPLHLVS